MTPVKTSAPGAGDDEERLPFFFMDANGAIWVDRRGRSRLPALLRRIADALDPPIGKHDGGNEPPEETIVEEASSLLPVQLLGSGGAWRRIARACISTGEAGKSGDLVRRTAQGDSAASTHLRWLLEDVKLLSGRRRRFSSTDPWRRMLWSSMIRESDDDGDERIH